MAANSRQAAFQLPLVFRKLVCTKLTPNFREAVTMQTVKVTEKDLKPTDVLIRNRYVGINASDINMTAGRYAPGVPPPFDLGMEALGEVVWTGDKCRGLSVGDTVAVNSNGAFAEYMILPERRVFPTPSLKPEHIALVISGTTASISLKKLGDLRPGQNVLVTAAAGGTGQFAVQLARLAGCHVIGTCSSDEKVEFLRSIGCDRPINYTKEDLMKVLREEYPNGVNVVYESVGGEVFNSCVRNLSIEGRLIIIGMITDYQDKAFRTLPTIPLQQLLLSKSASLCGFFLIHYLKDLPAHIQYLAELEAAGKLQVRVDLGAQRSEGIFRDLTSIPDAVDYLYSKRSQGKVVVTLNETTVNSKL